MKKFRFLCFALALMLAFTGMVMPVRAETVPLVEATSDAAVRDEFEFGDVGLVCTNPLLGSYADYRCD